MSSTSDEAKRQAEVLQRVTGEFFCQAGKHYSKGKSVMRRGRKHCEKCVSRIQQLTKKNRELK